MTAQPPPEATFSLAVDGEAVDFTHLEPFTFTCVTEGRPDGAVISVSFSNHCFTESFVPEAHEGRPTMRDDRGRERAFCPVRYGLSLRLPELVRALPAGQVFQTPEANYVRVQLDDGLEYRMYFNIRRAPPGSDHHLRMFVESAYPPDGRALATRRMQKVRFKLVVDKLLKNQKLRFAPR